MDQKRILVVEDDSAIRQGIVDALQFAGIVIQIVQTEKETVAGYRFLTGGNGTHDFRDFHFLTDSEIKKLAGNSL